MYEDTLEIRLVLEYVSNGELYDYIAQRGTLADEEARFVLAEVLDAVLYLHQTLGVAHRDLKPENILLDATGHVKLCDFGMSNAYHATSRPLLATHCGSPHYAAPELIRGQGYHPEAASFTPWSMGLSPLSTRMSRVCTS